jgi:hypothetical protein
MIWTSEEPSLQIVLPCTPDWQPSTNSHIPNSSRLAIAEQTCELNLLRYRLHIFQQSFPLSRYPSHFTGHSTQYPKIMLILLLWFQESNLTAKYVTTRKCTCSPMYYYNMWVKTWWAGRAKTQVSIVAWVDLAVVQQLQYAHVWHPALWRCDYHH